MIEVIDNYLPQDDYELIYNYFMGLYDRGDIANSCVWTFNDGISLPQDGYYQFVQQIFSCHTIISPAFSLLEKITEEMSAIIRIKANLITSTEELKIFDWAFHNDIPIEKTEGVTTAIYYVNSNDGYTLFDDGTKVDSVSNRFVKFPASLKHTGTTCTNTNRRVLINFNYYA
jgi:hypothetical protein